LFLLLGSLPLRQGIFPVGSRYGMGDLIQRLQASGRQGRRGGPGLQVHLEYVTANPNLVALPDHRLTDSLAVDE
jgi:hypothetical protein